MEKTSVAELLSNNSLLLDDKEMDVQLAHGFFEKHEHIFLPMQGGSAVLGMEYVENDRMKNKIILMDINSASLVNEWEITSVQLSNVFNKIAAAIEQNSALFAQIDYLIRGINPKDTQHFDIPMIAASFRYYANSSCTQNYSEAFVPLKVYEVPLSDVSPLVFLGWLVAPALALKCTVNLACTANFTAVTILFAELCFKAGLPGNALNVYPCSDDFLIRTPPSCLKYKDSMLELKENLIYPKRSRGTMIVCESADLDSTVDTIFKAAWSHNGMLPWSLKRILVQECIVETFKSKLSLKLKRHKFDKSVHGNLQVEIAKAVTDLVNSLNSLGIKHLDIHESFNGELQQNSPKPIVFVDHVPASEEDLIFDRASPLPIVLVQPFRTTKEVVAMVNSKPAVAVWIQCERLTIANEITVGVNASFIWLNSHGLFSCYANDCALLVEEKYKWNLDKRLPIKSEAHLGDPNSIIDKAAKLQSLWNLKSPEQRAQAFQTIAINLTMNSEMYAKKHANLCISEDKAAFLLRTSINFLQYVSTECLKPSSSSTLVNKTLHWKLRVPLGTVAVHPCYDLLHELFISVAAITLRGNAVIYATRSPLVIEFSKQLSEAGVPIVIHSDFKYSDVKYNAVKYNWSIPDYGDKNDCDDENMKITRLFNAAHCKEIMDRRFSSTKSVWSTFGETYAN